VREYIAARQNDIENTQRSLEAEKRNLSRSEDAISNLGVVTPKAYAALRLYEENLEDARKVQKRLQYPEIIEDMKVRGEPETSDWLNSLMSDLNQGASIGSGIAKQQIVNLEESIKKLRHHCNKLDDELVGWKFTQDLAKRSIDRFTILLEQLEADISWARATFSPVLKIPKEVWTKIFLFCFREEFIDYINEPGNQPFHHLYRRFSAVCRSWRNIVCSEPLMHRVVGISPYAYVSDQAREYLRESLKRGQESFGFVSNFSEPEPEPSLKDSSSQNDKEILPHAANYDVYLIIKDWSYNLSTKLYGYPFRQPQGLTIHLPLKEGALFGRISLQSFQEVERLKLICPASCITRFWGFDALHSLNNLNIQLHNLPNFSLQSILKPGLKELCIRHSKSSFLCKQETVVPLPSLKLLGVTYPSTTLIESIDVPNLEKLELYGPNYKYVNFENGAVNTSILQKVQKIEMADWHKPPVNDAAQEDRGSHKSNDVISVFVRFAGNMTKLQSAEFFRCHIDGSELVTLFRERSEKTTGILPHFEMLVLSNCRGITRSECEELQDLVSRVVVYV
jgi:hypothetical protein